MVGPSVGQAGPARGKEDGGLAGAEAGGRIVHVVLTVAVGNIWGPEILVAVGIRSRPGCAVRESGTDIAPVGAISGSVENGELAFCRFIDLGALLQRHGSGSNKLGNDEGLSAITYCLSPTPFAVNAAM